MSDQNSSSLTNLSVAIRIRPFTTRESNFNSTKTLHPIDSTTLLLINPHPTSQKRKETYYKFDKVFDDLSSQSKVFEETVEQIVSDTLEGFNSTVFAYGPTGTGKTYTMFGDTDSQGMVLQTFSHIFKRISLLSNRVYNIKLSYIEIYNENIRDLINPASLSLDIREDPVRGVIIPDLFEFEARDLDQVYEVLRAGHSKRTNESTEMNPASSRSHGIVIINAGFSRLLGTENEIVSARSFLVDLAWSEKPAFSKNANQRQPEGGNINKSLQTLGNCINILSEKGKTNFVPYRESKLTRILKESLGGKCKTLMISCLSGFGLHYEETLSTLEYANRAKCIKTRIEKNIVIKDHHITKYKEIINELQGEVINLKQRLFEGDKKIDINIEVYLAEIDQHFSREKRIKNEAFQIILTIDKLNEDMISLLQGQEEDETNELKYRIKENEEQLVKKNKEFSDTEKKRPEFEERWLGLSEESLTVLRFSLQKNIIQMFELDKKQKKTHEENMVKCKDLYIGLLEDKMKVRISRLEKKASQSPARIRSHDASPGLNKRARNYLEVKKAIESALKNEVLLPILSPVQSERRLRSKENEMRDRIKRYMSATNSSFDKGVGKLSKREPHIRNRNNKRGSAIQ